MSEKSKLFSCLSTKIIDIKIVRILPESQDLSFKKILLKWKNAELPIFVK